MKRFRFRLESVLGVRRLELERARGALAAAERHVVTLDQTRADLCTERAALDERVGRRLREGWSVPALQAASAALCAVATLIDHFAVEIEAARSAIPAARGAVVRAHTRVRSLEQLRERALAEHRREAAYAEQAELDEIGARRPARSLPALAALLFVALLASGGLSGTAAHAADATKPRSPGESSASGKESATPTTGAALALLMELRGRDLALDRRERTLEEREQIVVDLESEVVARIDELEALRERVEGRIAAWEEDHGDTVRRLAKIYAAMPPAHAARLVEALDVDLATQIVSKMKDKQSAAVMALVSKKRALAMSRQVVHPLRGKPAQVSPAALEERR